MLFLAETAWNEDATKTGIILCLFQEQPDPDEIYFPPLPQECNDLTRSLCSSSITEPSSLLRIGPPHCFALVLSPHGFHHLCLYGDFEVKR